MSESVRDRAVAAAARRPRLGVRPLRLPVGLPARAPVARRLSSPACSCTAGFLHLFGNMLFLWIYGDNVEHRLGQVRYLLWYLATGIAATLFHTLRASHSDIPLVGASGAISGVLGFYFVWFPRNHVRLLWLLPPFLMQTLRGARAARPRHVPRARERAAVSRHQRRFRGGARRAHRRLPGGRRGGVGHGSTRDGRASAGVRRRARGLAAAGSPTGRRASRAAIDAGRMEEAATEYFEVPAHASRGILSPEHSLALARWLLEHGHHEAALVVARRHLRDYPERPRGRRRAGARRAMRCSRCTSRRRPTSTSWPRSTPTRPRHRGGGAPRHRDGRGPAEAADRPSACAPGLT